jgi:signal transduction histidine kinase
MIINAFPGDTAMIVGIIAAAEIWIGVLCLISAIYSLSFIIAAGDFRAERGRLYQSGLLLTCFFLMTGSCISWYCNGVNTPSARTVLLAANTLLFTLSYVMGIFYTCYVCTWLRSSRSVLIYRPLCCALYGAAILYSLLNLRFHHLFYIDRAAYYHRGAYFNTFLWLSAPLALIHLYVLHSHRKDMTRKEYLALVLYLLIPMLMVLLSSFWYTGISLPNLGFGVSAFLMFMAMSDAQTTTYLAQQKQLIRQRETQAELKSEMHSLRVRLVLSQIQPHFLYNSLNTIYYLCGKHPQVAKTAIANFSDYLDGSMKSLSAKSPIPFREELQHIVTYLSLEKLRFDEDLEIVFQIGTTDFVLPALSVQPLVENAVKHGVGRKTGGGTVSLTTREDATHIYILVNDNGAGFGSDPPPCEEGHPHIGIENVRRRISTMSGGCLRILSAPGRGTSAKIVLPKARAGQESSLLSGKEALV